MTSSITQLQIADSMRLVRMFAFIAIITIIIISEEI